MSLQFHNPFPYTQFERDAASVIAVTPSLLRFTLCFFASVPLGAGLSLLKNPAARHLYALVTGFALVYVPFGNGVSLAILPCLLTYLVMWRMRDQAATFAWLIDFTFLIGCHVSSASGEAWKQGNMDFTGAQMILTLKLISTAVSYQDGLRSSPKLNEYQEKTKLQRMPSLLEYLSYIFATGNLLAGPTFELADYLAFIERRGPWDPSGKQPMPSQYGAGLVRLFKAVACLGLYLTLDRYFPIRLLEVDRFFRASISYKLGVVFMVGLVARFKFYFAWAISEASLIMSGFCFNGFTDQGAARWDRHSNTRIWEVETCTSASQYASSWNTCTGNFLRRYVYERLVPEGKKPTFRSLLVTQLVSGVWHGLFPGYAMFFVNTAFMFQSAKIVYRYERGVSWQGVGKFPPWVLVKWAFTSLCLNYSAAAFLLLDFWPAWRLWRSLHFAPHLMMTAIILTGQVIPPRRPKGSKSRPAAGGAVGGSGESEGSHARQGKEASASPSSLSPAAPVEESQRAKRA